jgi:hypothetical protein
VTNDTYQSWVQRVVGGREGKPLNEGDVVKSSAGEPFGALQFVKFEKKGFLAEVAKKGEQYIYHFYPEEKYHGAIIYRFHEPMAEAFLQVFQRPEQVESVWEEEMMAFAVRVSGFVNTVWGDDQAVRVIDVVEEKLAERDKSLGA